jgi:hypothetical protein
LKRCDHTAVVGRKVADHRLAYWFFPEILVHTNLMIKYSYHCGRRALAWKFYGLYWPDPFLELKAVCGDGYAMEILQRKKLT